MNRIFIIVAILIALAVAGIYWLLPRSQTTLYEPLPTDNLIHITSPKPDQIISSPLRVEGEARGNWYFEASFPVRLIDEDGHELAVAPASAQGEWMTTEFVPFAVDLKFDPPSTSKGTLILEKDNPSGLPEHADERRIPVRFE